jgi:hypothetical protein
MPKVATVMDFCARQCSLGKRSGWIADTSATALELKDFLAETVDEVLDRLDLPSPVTRETTITGNGTAGFSYPLPIEFKRLVRDDAAVLELTLSRRPLIPVSTNGAWTAIELQNAAGANRYYRIIGDDVNGFFVQFLRTLETGSQVKVAYVTKNWMQNVSSVAGVEWTDDEDLLVLPEVITRLGVIWRFKRKKGLPFGDLQAEYEIRMTRAINDARGLRTVNMTGSDTESHPMRVPVPDYIAMG